MPSHQQPLGLLDHGTAGHRLLHLTGHLARAREVDGGGQGIGCTLGRHADERDVGVVKGISRVAIEVERTEATATRLEREGQQRLHLTGVAALA